MTPDFAARAQALLARASYADLPVALAEELRGMYAAGAALPSSFDPPPPLVRSISITPAYDRRKETPNYGRHACELHFNVQGPLGMVQWRALTTWELPSGWDHTPRSERIFQPDSFGLYWHGVTPDGTNPHECNYLPAGQCYGSMRSTGYDDWPAGLVAHGTDWLWEKLEAEYHRMFEGAPHE